MRVLLGVGGGIAAFKACETVRRLRERGHEVRCALTRAATSFVSPLTLEVLSGQKVYREEYLEPTGTGEELHITCAAWAEVVCIAPATAHLLARLALGLADDFLTTTVLASERPLLLAPAMHSAMWRKPTVAEHVALLRQRGTRFIGPVEGVLASGEIGWGRMAEPEAIVAEIEASAARRDLAGRRVLVSAGPTHEPIDPVRYLGNRSSGKMGFALAAEAAERGAAVVLVAGPVVLATPPGVRRIDVETAREMEAVIAAEAPSSDLIVMAAAVADFRPRHRSERKIKKGQGAPAAIELELNPDILSGLARLAPSALRVGFAAETQDLAAAAAAKLEQKGADLIVANAVGGDQNVFGSDDNEVLVFRRGQPPLALPRRAKRRIATALFDLLVEELTARAGEAAHATR